MVSVSTPQRSPYKGFPQTADTVGMIEYGVKAVNQLARRSGESRVTCPKSHGSRRNFSATQLTDLHWSVLDTVKALWLGWKLVALLLLLHD
jgi:hypothetical protein